MDAKVRTRVILRDGGCIAPLLDRSAGPCRDTWGTIIARTSTWLMEYDHVHLDGENAMGMKAKDDERRGVAACPWHHRLGNPPWLPTHRRQVRDHLATCYPSS